MGVIAGKRVVHYVKSGFQVEEFMKCRKSPYYFIHKYVRITHQQRGSIPFVPYPFQASILMGWLKYQATCMLKPRQMGISTLAAGYLLWMFLFHSHKDLLLISIKQNTARALMRRIKHMYRNLPDFLKIEIVNGSGGSLGTADILMGANGSTLEVQGSTNDAGRSGSYACVVFDEAAFQLHADTTFGAAGPATLNNGGKIIVLSTAFGMGNFFHRTYTGALAGDNGFHPIRLKWQMHPDYDAVWHARQLALLGRLRTAQEIDCNFLQSGYNVFDMAKIRAIEDRLLEFDPVETREDDKWLIYEKPVAGIEYVLGGDVATGRSRDYSTFSIFKLDGTEVACYKAKIGVRNYAKLIMRAGRYYNNALLAPEVNAIGEGVVAVCQEDGYDNIYHSVSKVLHLDEFEKDESMVQGWLTTGKSRHEIITGMDDDLKDDLVELNNPYFVQEAYTFIYNAANKAIAMGKGSSNKDRNSALMYEDEDAGTTYTDDAILGACIGNEVRKNPARWRGTMPIWTGQ